MHPLPPPHAAFLAKKSRILSQLSVPDAEYTDASPKGSVDEGIRHLIDEINGRDGLVTTSSCAGRVSVFVEGSKKGDGGQRVVEGGDAEAGNRGEEKPASAVGGKGGGGTWLFVSHEKVDEGVLRGDGGGVAGLLGLDGFRGGDGDGVREVMGGGNRRLVHFKFEPMVCLTSFSRRDMCYADMFCRIDPACPDGVSVPRPSHPQGRSSGRFPGVWGRESPRLWHR